MGQLDGRVAIITGAARGLGRAHALLFAAEGASVVVNDVGANAEGRPDDGASAQAVVDEITAAGGRAVANTDDVADWAGGQRLVRSAIEHYGELHVLVNNAGFLRDRMLVNMSEDDWDSVVSVHLKGHFVPTRHAAAYWREQTKAGRDVTASIINTSSTSGLHGNPGQANYGAAKAGLESFSRHVALESAPHGITVNTVALGTMSHLRGEPAPAEHAAAIPVGRFGTPEDVGWAVGFLASDRASWITGQTLHLNGGAYMA